MERVVESLSQGSFHPPTERALEAPSLGSIHPPTERALEAVWSSSTLLWNGRWKLLGVHPPSFGWALEALYLGSIHPPLDGHWKLSFWGPFTRYKMVLFSRSTTVAYSNQHPSMATCFGLF